MVFLNIIFFSLCFVFYLIENSCVLNIGFWTREVYCHDCYYYCTGGKCDNKRLVGVRKTPIEYIIRKKDITKEGLNKDNCCPYYK